MKHSERFLENLESYGLGELVSRMSINQDKIVSAVRESGLTGSLKLDLTFKRSGSSGILVQGKLTPKIPEMPIQPVEMFVDDNNRLHEENPAQMSIDNVHELQKQKEVNEA